MKKQIKIKANNCIFRGQTVSKGDLVPTKNFPKDLTEDEIAVMVPRLGSLVKEETPSAKKTAAKKTANNKD